MMPKIDLRQVQQGKMTDGRKVLLMKGVGWSWQPAADGWIYPVPQNGGQRPFDGHVSAEPDGTWKVTTGIHGGSANARCAILDIPPPGTNIEFESHLDRAGSSSRLILRQVTDNSQSTGTAVYDVNGPVNSQLHRTDVFTIGAGITMLHIIGTHSTGGFFKVLPQTRYRIVS